MYYNREERTIYVISLPNNQPAWTYRIPEELTIETWGNSFFSDQSHLFMKLHMGGIMAFSLINGEVLWKWFGEETYSSFCTAANFVYVNDGNRITEININNGQPERILDFHNLAEYHNLRANGSIFGYDDILVFKNSHSGEIAVLDRNTFKLKGRDIVDPLGIAEGPKVIHYVDRILYVMGMSSKVNIYKVLDDE
ncbi:MAG: hypothetical protein K9I84_07945 [Leadbetterella sp.]|jgi:outer membrane protein assembly factor BamB|nr:hypothetical protein [Leadbetterella sp.]